LDERAGELLGLPWRRRLASTKPNDHVFPADRLARVQGDVLDDAVALVEDSEDRDALRHGRNSALPIRGRSDLRSRGCGRILLLLRALAAGGERKRNQQWCSKPSHAYSGIQGS
jgi:hypothetical protein